MASVTEHKKLISGGKKLFYHKIKTIVLNVFTKLVYILVHDVDTGTYGSKEILATPIHNTYYNVTYS